MYSNQENLTTTTHQLVALSRGRHARPRSLALLATHPE